MDDHKVDPAVGLQVQVGVLGERVSGIEKNLSGQISTLSQQLVAALIELKGGYATKSEMAAVDQRVEKIASSIGWVVKSVMFLLITAVVATVLVKGGPHP